MRMSYHELVGKQVVTADGHRLGRLTDLVAERRGEALRVTRLIVGQTGMIRRIGFRHSPLPHIVPPYRIPWRLVARIDKDIHLCIDRAAVQSGNAQDDADDEER